MFENLGILNIGTYIIGVIFIILVPGPNSLYVLKSSATFGYKKVTRPHWAYLPVMRY